MAVDHCEITGKKSFLEAVRKSNRNVRGVDGQTKWETMNLKIKPVESETGEYRLVYGVRDDNVQGLEQLLFNGSKSVWRAGHGIHDVDTSVLMSIAEEIYHTVSEYHKKGQSEISGSMEV